VQNWRALLPMSKTVFLFPGQGAQIVGMWSDLYNNSPAAKSIYDLADEILGYKISALCFNGPVEELTRTCNAQPALLATSIAILRAAEEAEALPEANYGAGHSLGEYSALVACGAMVLPGRPSWKKPVGLIRVECLPLLGLTESWLKRFVP
jgi:[acyl-carrier-protein] S-malonyltransferase